MAMKTPVSKVYWSDDVKIDPNIFFGTAHKPEPSIWSRARTPSLDLGAIGRRSRTPSDGSLHQGERRTKGIIRLGSVTNLVSKWKTRRGTLLSEKVAQTARLSRENSFDQKSPDSPQPSTSRRFSALARVRRTLNGLVGNRKKDSIETIDEIKPIDKFKIMVRKIQIERKMSGEFTQDGQIITDLGGIHRRTVSFGDVTLGAINKTVDRKKLHRLHMWGQEANRKRLLIRKFQRAVRLTIFCARQAKAHAVKPDETNEFTTFLKVDFQGDYEPADLLFDPSKFKANKQSRITDEFTRIMSMQAHQRTEAEIYYAQIALRNIGCFEDFPARMQRKIAETGMYEKFEAKRVIVRQGHPASSYYFILSGAVAVMVVDEGESYAKPVAYLTKGQTFGELAIINRKNRQSSIIAREESQFLTISVDDYHNIFMAGGVKTMNDPDHDEFMKSLSFLKGWPLKLLKEKTNKCLFLYFKRGDVLVKDSQYSDWLIVIKSGSVAVLKKLRKVEAYESRDAAKAAKFITDKHRRDRQNKKTLWKKLILPEINVPLKGLDEISLSQDYSHHFDKDGDPIPFTHPEVNTYMGDESVSTRKIWNFGSRDHKPGNKLSHVQLPQIVVSTDKKSPRQPTPTSKPSPSPEPVMSTDDEEGESNLTAQLSATYEDGQNLDYFKSHIRTINTDLDSGFARKDPQDITAADLNPEFVHIQTLTKGRVFGLSDLILGQQTSFCVVSNGADCLLISKQLFMEHMPDSLFGQLRMDLCPYPTEEELQSSLQVSVDWKAYKGQTLTKTLNFVRKRKEFLQHLKA